jgi:UDP-N-acetylglucosamine acyltransferase
VIHRLAVIGDSPEHRDWNEACEMFYPVIHPTARVEALVTVDAGMLRPTRVGARSWLMKKVHVGHDAQIGDDCEIAPMTSVGGEVEIGNSVKVGQGAVFKPRVTVGDGAVIGCGAVVVKDVEAGMVMVGNPARELVKA